MSDFQRPESDVKIKPLENVQKQQVKVEDIPASLPIVRPAMCSTSTSRMNRIMDSDKSKWMHQRSSPVKKMDKLMVRTSLVRSESVGSQKISSTFKVNYFIVDCCHRFLTFLFIGRCHHFTNSYHEDCMLQRRKMDNQ